MTFSLTTKQVDAFNKDGLLILRGFYDVGRDIDPILRGIHQIIGLIIQRHRLPVEQRAFSRTTFDDGYQEMIRIDRRLGGEVYDAVKQIPAFMRLVMDPRHEYLIRQLRGTDMPGVAASGYGIRIDNPGEERFRATWHQEYLGQLRSLDGIGFWIPLHHIDSSLGAVEFCVGSHREGLLRVRAHDMQNPEKTGVYGVRLEREREIVRRYPQVAPETKAGDLLALDFLIVHRSGHNTSQRPRWSMQTRYFNFNDPTGIKIGWCGSYASGKNVSQVHPELFVDSRDD